MLTASVENMLVTSIDTTLETGVVPTQYIVIISTFRRQKQTKQWTEREESAPKKVKTVPSASKVMASVPLGCTWNNFH